MRTASVILLATLILAGCSRPTVHRWDNTDVEQRNAVFVNKVISGDEIELVDKKVIKYIGIRVPKGQDLFAKKSQAANAKLIRRGGGKVFLEFDDRKRDAQGRYLAYVFSPVNINEKQICCFINLEMIEFGYAFLEESSYNRKYVKLLFAAYNRAQKNKAGVWAAKK